MAGYELVDRVTEVVRLTEGRRVLHLGCTNWPYTADGIERNTLLHARLHQVAADLVGLDADADGIKTLERAGLGPVVNGDVEDLAALATHDLISPGFDVVVAAEIIEHVNNPGLMLRGVPALLRPGGKLIITTINAFGAVRIVPYALRGRGGEQEPVHPDHVAYYSPATLRLLLQRHDFVVEKIMFYRLAREHREHNSWWINAANDIGTMIAKQLSDGLVTVAVPSDARR